MTTYDDDDGNYVISISYQHNWYPSKELSKVLYNMFGDNDSNNGVIVASVCFINKHGMHSCCSCMHKDTLDCPFQVFIQLLAILSTWSRGRHIEVNYMVIPVAQLGYIPTMKPKECSVVFATKYIYKYM